MTRVFGRSSRTKDGFELLLTRSVSPFVKDSFTEIILDSLLVENLSGSPSLTL